MAPLVAFCLNFVAATYESRWGHRLGSELLLADAGHTRADAGVSLALVGGLIAVRAGYPVVDPLLALVIAIVVARVGVQVARETADVLADAAALDSAEVARIAREVPGVEGVHKVRSRGPVDSIAVDLHVQVDPALGLERGHEIGHAVEDRLCESLPGVTDVVVHVEPEWELVGGDITAAVRRVAGRYPVDVHEIHVHTGRRTEVGLHLEMDPALSLDEAHDMATELEGAILADVPELDRVVTHLEPSANRVQVASEVRALGSYAELVARETEAVRGLFDPHDIEVVQVADGLRLSMHVRSVGELPLPDAHALAEELEARLRSADPTLVRITIHLEPA
jgi:divalent metal cation (Fe/Co/Zn/Cd) transporter